MCSVEANLQEQLDDYLQLRPGKVGPRSGKTTFAMASFDGKYRIL